VGWRRDDRQDAEATDTQIQLWWYNHATLDSDPEPDGHAQEQTCEHDGTEANANPVPPHAGATFLISIDEQRAIDALALCAWVGVSRDTVYDTKCYTAASI